MQAVVLPPHDARPRAFGDDAVFEDDRFADVQFGAKGAERYEVRSFDVGTGSGVVRCCGEHDLSQGIGGGPNPHPQENIMSDLDRLDAGKPTTAGGKAVENDASERFNGRFLEL